MAWNTRVVRLYYRRHAWTRVSAQAHSPRGGRRPAVPPRHPSAALAAARCEPAAARQGAGLEAAGAEEHPRRGAVANLPVRRDCNLEKAVLEELFGVASDFPPGAGRVDDGMVRLRRAAAAEVEVLLLVVRPLQDLDVSLEGLLARILGPDHDLCLVPGGVDVEVADRAARGALAVVHPALHAVLHRRRVKHVFGDLADGLGLVGRGHEDAALERELVGAVGRDLEHGAQLLELQRRLDGEGEPVHAIVDELVHAPVGSDPQLHLGLDRPTVGRLEHVLHALRVRRHLKGLERLAALDADVGHLVGGP
mmetsp:Transcript_49190/g.158324  ORF Transcript_49190/g.158324 Transcript_49190/m.158324 type:complete len:308 (-) Transcript_49190:243-1166(-)